MYRRYTVLSRLLSSLLCVRTYDAEGERPFIILKAPALISPVALQPSNQSTKATRNNPPHLATRPALDGNTLTHYTHSCIDNVTLLLEIVLIHLFAAALTCSNLIPLLTERHSLFCFAPIDCCCENREARSAFRHHRGNAL